MIVDVNDLNILEVNYKCGHISRLKSGLSNKV